MLPGQRGGPAGRRRPEQPRHRAQHPVARPGPIALAASAWQIGPLRLAGNPLDWQATLHARADDRQLSATLAARGSRIGQVDGQLAAAMLGAWSLARDTPGKAACRPTSAISAGWRNFWAKAGRAPAG